MNLRKLSWAWVWMLSGCILGTVRIFPTPVSPGEGEALVPALLTAASQAGVRAWRGVSGAVVQLEDGTYLNWQESMDHRDFHLAITVAAGIPETEVQTRFDAAKARADQIWGAAIEARRGAMVAPPLAYPVAQLPPPPPTGFSVGLNVPGLSVNVGGALPSQCVTGADGRQACGYACRIGADGRAACAPTPDGSCQMNSNGTLACGRFCQMQSSGFYICQ